MRFSVVLFPLSIHKCFWIHTRHLHCFISFSIHCCHFLSLKSIICMTLSHLLYQKLFTPHSRNISVMETCSRHECIRRIWQTDSLILKRCYLYDELEGISVIHVLSFFLFFILDPCCLVNSMKIKYEMRNIYKYTTVKVYENKILHIV